MTDIYMILILAGIFGMFFAFTAWCSHIVDESGGESK